MSVRMRPRWPDDERPSTGCVTGCADRSGHHLGIRHNACMAQPKASNRPAPKPMPGRELKPWQLAVFIVTGLLIAGIFVGVGYAKKSNDEYGQWPWSRTAVPPKMYYDHEKYAGAAAGSKDGLVVVGKTPGGGTIYASSTATDPAPGSIVVVDPANGTAKKYTLVPKSK
jgi:hypothetical protein